MNLNDFHFIRPFWLLTLIPYLVVLALLIRSKLSQGNWSAVCDAELLPYLLENKIVHQSRLPLISGALAGLLAILALAGPTWERLPAPAFRNDSALVILLDLSRSMQAADLKPSRLVMARYKISDILKQRKDGQSALIAYSGDAFTVTPLTTDTETIDNQLAALTPDIMPSDGNNLSRALDKAVGLFKQAGLQKGQILLLTDGGELGEAISKAKSLGDYQLLVLSVGSADGAPIALPSGDFLKDGQGNIIVDKVDTGGLERLAQAGGGIYHALTPDDSDINALFSEVSDKLQAQAGKNDNLFLEQWSDKGPWLLLAVLPLAALCFRKGVLTLMLAILLPWSDDTYAFEMPKNWQDLWQTKDQQAQKAYENKEYEKAAELFENQDWKEIAKYQVEKLTEGEMKEPNTALGYYNQGTILAKSGESHHTKNELEKAVADYEKAIAKYAKALTKKPKEDLKQDIKTNQDIVSKELEKLKKELEKQKQEQKQDQNQQNKDDKKDSQDKQQQNPEQNKDGKSSDQSEQKQQDSQQTGDKDQKPEQKPEQSQQDLEKQAEKKEADDKKKSEDEQKQAQAQPAKKDDNQDKNKPEGEQAIAPEMTKEEQQANEQWLNRIPDDPAGLLRRKFKYQYDQRGQQ